MRRVTASGRRITGPRLRLILVGALALAVAGTLAVVVTTGRGPGADGGAAGASGTPQPGSTAPVLRELSAQEAGQQFLQGYVDPDGRVVRHDQGGDTVSEGQAYAMLVAVGLGDRERFGTVWRWTKTNLTRANDGLLSWRWADGQVVDASSASDADLDAARALVLAGDRFGDQALTADGIALGKAVLDHETVTTDLGRILVAGNWATPDPYAYNPSYASPAATAVLATASDDKRWAQLDTGTRAVTKAVLDQTDLPPDWAQVHDDGRVEPMPGAAGRGNEGVRYGYDATRTSLRFAESCAPEDVALAARMTTALNRFPGDAAARDLGGSPLTTDQSVVAAAAKAAAFAASGDTAGATAQLVIAGHLQQQGPTYYGSAWDALGRLMLTDTALGGCPPVAP